ncbi:hypothetical protein [Flavobacterium poyangense]|uniref:hypothetical protein n=1 Tax=Flavobacterium poyangense TaxID=2204302 RepID=UPI00141E45DF|nr:hypothetical protein [Flavobacterium sp. JXAS1]
MEPNNFEKDFREKLNQRKIEPSDKAWDRLDAMLSVAEEKKSVKKNRKGLYVAASVVGFLLVGMFFFNQKTIKTPKTVVVEKEIKKDSIDKSVPNTVEPLKTEAVVAEETQKETVNKEEKEQNQISNKTIKKESNQIAESSIINQQSESINHQRFAKEMPKGQTAEELLISAEKTVVAENSTKPKAKIKINADDLLHQVDGELELSFREKVITKVNKNYQTVKVALANRNQQE